MVHNIELELVRGDTVVFVDLPSTPRDPRRHADCDGIRYTSCNFRVHSERLLATGSAKLAEMLSPAHQHRIQRRRRMANALPQGVKYILDLTPPSEGDELVFEMTELSLTPGIMKWWSSYRFHHVDPSLVTGHDDVCTCKRQAPGSPHQGSDDGPRREQTDIGKGLVVQDMGPSAEAVGPFRETGKPKPIPPRPQQLMEMRASGDCSIYDTPPFRRIPDYCPVRHRNAIIRLLMLVEGRDVHFDSASRVWTMVALAKIFDCAPVVRDRVVQWIMHDANTKFIEVLPEEALRIGFALENVQLTQCAFRILVNELALKEAAAGNAQPRFTRTTIFGRRLGECGDELNNLIQHAARALVERVSLTNTQFRSTDLLDSWGIQEWGKLRRLERLLTRAEGSACRVALVKLRRLMASLSDAVGCNFVDAAREHLPHQKTVLESMDMDRATYVLPEDFTALSDIVSGMNLVQKLLLPFIYNNLRESLEPRLRGQPAIVGRPWHHCLLLEEVEMLQKLVGGNPAMTCKDEWLEFLEPANGPAGVECCMVKSPLVSLDRMDEEVKEALGPLTHSWIRRDIDPPLNITRHMLLTLTMNEMKFLPLWAGGLNDGTGGVFESFVPPADMGPNGPGPAYHTGHTLSSAPGDLSESVIEDMVAVRFTESTMAASTDVRGSASTVHRPGTAIVDNVSMMSEAFTAKETEYQAARPAVPAEGEEHEGRTDDFNRDVDGLTDFDFIAVDGLEPEEDDVERPFSDTGGSEDSVVLVGVKR